MSVASMLSRFKQYLEGRKRKSEEPSEASTTTTFAKYRRVADDFPKFISTPLNNDLHSKSDLVTHRLKNTQYIRKPMSGTNNNDQQSAYFCGSSGKTRLEFADIEFSDDEDELDWINRQHKPNNRSNKNEDKPNSAAIARRPPPLAKLRTSTAPVPPLYPIRTHLVNGNSETHSKQHDAFKKPAVLKSQQQQQQTKRNSIIAQKYNLDEVNNYRALLKRLLPNLYSPEEPKSSFANSRKNSLLADDFNLSSSTAINSSHAEQQKAGPSSSSIRSIPVIDLSLEESDLEGRKKSTSLFTTVDLSQYDVTTNDEAATATQVVDPVNTLREKLQTNSKFRDDIVENVQRKYCSTSTQRKDLIEQERENLKELRKNTQQYEGTFERKLGDFMLKFDTIVLDEEEPKEEEEAYPELTEEHQGVIKRALYGGSRTEVIVSKFNISITRNDLATLVGDNWLNDEVINFYMNLLMERSEQGADDGLPRVYAMNTFFIPKLLSAGHAGLKRWTRKVDIFTYDIIPVPVHVGRVHWCMAIIDLKNKSIRYYDSMGTPNNSVLNALEQYLRDESLDKRKKPFDTSGFAKQNMSECPRQMNGSDCGVFSCMFAEHESRNREIEFTQQHMPYFRQKMMYEISQGRLLT
ncbi:sentrin-specific protease 1-like isoform X2 [Toxorhynchites rutilus septentrionalis]|uniref:sentrin-specific protease 1-like isoform X2 n=1 Tax=Toxorhynchites rutilus septentrionalis TaxID=329112 RepID=UPI00247A3C6D|nr:sentrin-specific protease 1-like isoform X2 [Toxorhynchites rutilus septentrionalis]